MKRFILAIMVLSLMFVACEEEEETPTDLKTTLTATFTGDFNCPGCDPGILFYSDLDGQVLWSGTFTGNDTVVAVLEDGFPERMSMTTVTYDDRYDRLSIITNLNVKSDSYIWVGGGADYRWNSDDSQVALKIENDPGHSGYFVASGYTSRRSGGGTLETGYVKSIRSSQDNLFIRINPLNGSPTYTWKPNVHLEDSVLVDLGDMTPMQSKTIIIPDLIYDRTLDIRGFDTDYYSGYYRFESFYPYQIESSSPEIYYPSGLFTGYRTNLYVDEEPYPTMNGWNSIAIGNIPSSLTILTSDFTFVEDGMHDVEVDITGAYTQMSYSFNYESDAGVYYGWTIYTESSAVDLIELPALVYSTYSDFDVDSMLLTSARIAQHDDLNYDEHVQQFFKSGEGIYNWVSSIKSRSKDPAGLRPPE